MKHFAKDYWCIKQMAYQTIKPHTIAAVLFAGQHVPKARNKRPALSAYFLLFPPSFSVSFYPSTSIGFYRKHL